ncbi:hypothetical protein [Paraburkholderia nodosa]|uniref:hypothetical protein n=1 Tax=Paraburkholderia nodosa TaxID=392320 RepID=UPI00047F722C|nr:hypothetical protein [Paraburkholderia nodosa]
MDQAFLRVRSASLEHFTLLELIACSTAGILDGKPVNEDCKVSCETGATDCMSPTNALTDTLPAAVRRVLGDARVSAFTRELLASGALRLYVDAGTLQRRCELIERQWRDQELLCAFVERQASIPMIRRFFRTATRTTISQLRDELGVAPPTKPRALAPSAMDTLFDAWARLNDIGDPRERYLALHERYQGQWSLATLFAALEPDTRDCHPTSSLKESHHVRHAT